MTANADELKLIEIDKKRANISETVLFSRKAIWCTERN